MADIIKRTSQYIDNLSFDETYEQAAVEILTENTGGTALERQKTIATEETLQAVAGLFTLPYDSVYATYDDPNFKETYVSKLATVTQETVTVIFTDATKEKLVSAIRT